MNELNPLNLGQLISLLETQEQDYSIEFDFAGCAPTEFASYRGNYFHLGIDFNKHSERLLTKPKTVGEFLTQCRECIGKVFEGYKGGEYLMDENSEVYVAEYGCSYTTRIISVKDGVLKTGDYE